MVRGGLLPIIHWRPEAPWGFMSTRTRGEAYYILSGTGEFNDNGTIVTVAAGDVTFTGAGEGHALKNTGTEPLEFIALIIYE